MAVAEKPPRVNTSHARRAHSSQRFSSHILADDLENLVCGLGTRLNPLVEDNVDEYIRDVMSRLDFRRRCDTSKMVALKNNDILVI